MGGGVGIYFKNGIKFQQKDKSIFIEKVIETIFADVWLNGKKFTIGSVYRSNGKHPTLSPNDQFLQFLELFNNTVEHLSSPNIEILIAGDFNIDVLKYQNCNMATTYIDSLFSNGLLQSMIKPTRCTNSSASCIDHFISNFPQKKFESCISNL
jgi:exonuclease III